MTVKITLLGHACLHIQTPKLKFVTDPWLVGSAFCGGWKTKLEPPGNWKEIINDVDFIYISHNHNDHLNENTLEHIRKDIPMLIPKFKTGSVKKPLQNLGFYNFIPLDFCDTYTVEDCVFVIYPSGDDRDDSGLLMGYQNFKFLTSVDSNNLNNGKLPDNITVYASSFAGGASGYPLLFNNKTEQEKIKILEDNLLTLKTNVKATIEKTKAKYYLPYAGFNYIENDYVRKTDILLDVEDYQDDKYELLRSDKNDEWIFDVPSLNCFPANIRRLKNNRIVTFEKKKNKNKLVGLSCVEEYFSNAKFKSNLRLYLDVGLPEWNEIDFSLLCRFNENKFNSVYNNRLAFYEHCKTEKNLNLLYLFVDRNAIDYIITNKRPIEDIFIGNACRIDRYPDTYDVDKDFWHYFSNIYRGAECG
jgi:CMP-N-acetylneuraminate monooxygenase